MIMDISLYNTILYEGCEIKEVGGRLTLTTAISDATNIVGRNALKMISNVRDSKEIVLTGPMAVWAYLIVFHIVVHRFSKVYYNDGRSGEVLIAQH